MRTEGEAIHPALPSKHYSMNRANILFLEPSCDPSAVRLVGDIVPHARDLNDIKNDAGKLTWKSYRVQNFKST